MSTYEDIQPPRLGRSMLLRFALAAITITLLTGASVATAVLLEVKTVADIIKNESTPLAPGVKDLLADVEPGKAQTILMIGDDRRKNEVLAPDGKALKHPPPTRSDTMILVRLDPVEGRHGADVPAARPRRRHPRATDATGSTPPSPTARTSSRCARSATSSASRSTTSSA